MLRKLLIIIFVLILLVFAYKFARAKTWLPDKTFAPLEKKLPQQIKLPWQKEKEFEFKQEDLDKIGKDGLSQIKVLSEKAKSAGGVAQSFVQEVVKEDKDNEKNVSEKAFEYGRYIYCQEVVRQYENNNSTKKN